MSGSALCAVARLRTPRIPAMPTPTITMKKISSISVMPRLWRADRKALAHIPRDLLDRDVRHVIPADRDDGVGGERRSGGVDVLPLSVENNGARTERTAGRR